VTHFGRLPGDAPQTRQRRRAILAAARLTSGLSPDHGEQLLAASSLATQPGGTLLFSAGDAPDKIFLVGSGTVRVCMGGAEASAMQIGLRGPGDVVAEQGLVWLAAGLPRREVLRQDAVVTGAPAEILGIDQAVLAAVLAQDAAARGRLAAELAWLLDALARLAGELASFKNFAKPRLARLLTGYFDHMGRAEGGILRIPHKISDGDMADALGLTRRSVLDDRQALESFDAIEVDQHGHLVLRDRARLLRIASLPPPADRAAGATAWRADIEAALAAGDTLGSLELAREALLYFPHDKALGYTACLAALRAGALETAETLIEKCRFTDGDRKDEAVASLGARVLKERAFACSDRATGARLALDSATAYFAVHRRTAGRYSALNAASMYMVAGREAAGRELAQALVAAKPASGYWGAATRAEAFWLLGHQDAAAASLREAAAAADADDGKIATTRQQIQFLAGCLGRDASVLEAGFPARRVMVDASGPVAARRLALGLALLQAASTGARVTLVPEPAGMPDWAAPDMPADGQAAILWVQAANEAGMEELSTGLAAAEFCVDGSATMLRFAKVSQALAAARMVRRGEGGIHIRMCMDMEALGDGRLGEARLARMQMLSRPGEIFATGAAAAELALLRRPDLRLVAVGRVRNQRRLDRLRAWAVRDLPVWH
jgi:CRP-like cAMP-binding protein